MTLHGSIPGLATARANAIIETKNDVGKLIKNTMGVNAFKLLLVLSTRMNIKKNECPAGKALLSSEANIKRPASFYEARQELKDRHIISFKKLPNGNTIYSWHIEVYKQFEIEGYFHEFFQYHRAVLIQFIDKFKENL